MSAQGFNDKPNLVAAAGRWIDAFVFTLIVVATVALVIVRDVTAPDLAAAAAFSVALTTAWRGLRHHKAEHPNRELPAMHRSDGGSEEVESDSNSSHLLQTGE